MLGGNPNHHLIRLQLVSGPAQHTPSSLNCYATNRKQSCWGGNPTHLIRLQLVSGPAQHISSNLYHYVVSLK